MSSTANDLFEIRIKVTGKNFELVAQVLQEISNLYANASCSTVMQSQPQGFHGFISIRRSASPTGPRTIRAPQTWEVKG